MKKYIVILLVISSCICLPGCAMFNSQIPDLSQEQHDMVVEYATETLLSYDKRNGDKVKDQPDDFVIPVPVVVEEEVAEPEDTSEEDSVADNEVPSLDLTLPEEGGLEANEVETIDNTQGGVSTNFSPESAMGLKDLATVSFVGCEIRDAYPDTTDSYFIMKASEGCSLVVLNFTISNISGSDIDIDVPGNNLRFKIALNGKVKNALTTLLLNDLAYYKDLLGAGQSVDVVLIGEYPSEECANVDSLDVVIKSSDGSSTMKLQ